jgi:hypothetical protein
MLGMAFSEHLATNCMYSFYAFGYKRLCPLFSVHSYRHITRPVEVNPWVPGARGTFINAIAKIRRALEYAKGPADLDPAGGRARPNAPVPPGPVGIDPRDLFSGDVGRLLGPSRPCGWTAFPTSRWT